MLSSVGVGLLQSAPVLALKRMLPPPKRFMQGRRVAMLGWADAVRMSLTVLGWVDSLEGGKRGACLAGVTGTVGGAVGP